MVATLYTVITKGGSPHERKFVDHKTVMAVFRFAKVPCKNMKQ